MLAAASHDFYRTCRRGHRGLLPGGELQSTSLVSIADMLKNIFVGRLLNGFEQLCSRPLLTERV